MEEESLSRIAGKSCPNFNVRYYETVIDKNLANLDLPREKIQVLYKNPDRANIYQQRRVLKQQIDIM